MADFSVAVVNAWASAYETTIGASPIVEIRSGAKPADCDDPDSGTLLASITAPSDWMGAASGGIVSLIGSWIDSAADAAGTAGHYRIWNSGRTVCHDQGTVTATGGGGDMTLDNTSIAAGQQVQITSWSRSFAAQL
jgi:hypothetical protein